MRTPSNSLMRMTVAPKVFGERPPSAEQHKNCVTELFKNCLPRLDKQLAKKQFFCGDSMSMADFHHYNEIANILNLTKRELTEAEFPNLAPWYNERMGRVPEIM